MHRKNWLKINKLLLLVDQLNGYREPRAPLILFSHPVDTLSFVSDKNPIMESEMILP